MGVTLALIHVMEINPIRVSTAELSSETVEISSFVHETCQDLTIKFYLITFNFAPIPLIRMCQVATV